MNFVHKWLFPVFIFLAFPFFAFAHEVYVLSPIEIQGALSQKNLSVFSALQDPHNGEVFVIISVGVIFFVVGYFFLRRMFFATKLEKNLEKMSPFAPVFVRVAVGISLVYGSFFLNFLGPEVPLLVFSHTFLYAIVLFFTGIFLCLGLFTEVAGILGILVFLSAFFHLGTYMFNYVNYLGEFVLLVLVGSRFCSLDSFFFGKRKKKSVIEQFETPLLRVTYALSLMYTAISVKFLHPALTLEVVNRYNLTQFHFLFPHDPLLLVFGAALAELTIGIFILIGFETRLVVLISLFYITLSLFFFKEAVWPHIILYGLSFYLLCTKTSYSLDSFLERYFPKRQ